MLVLTRKKNEKIMIGDNIIVEVVAINGNRVRLGITTSRGTRIMREELLSPVEKLELSNKLLL